MYRSIFFLPLILLGMIAGQLAAVPDAGSEVMVEENNTVPQTEVAVISLGPTPPRRYSNAHKRGESVMLLPVAGEVPPARLFRRAGASAEQEGRWQPFNLSFNNPSPMSSIPAGKTLALFRKKAKGEEYERYVTIPAGEQGSRRVIFLTPSARGKQAWVKPPKVWTIPLDAGNLQGKQFILQNLSQTMVLHAFGNKITEVRKKEIIAYQRAEAGMLYRHAARYGKQKKIIYNMALRLDEEGNTHLYALYDTNPDTNAGRSVGVFKTVIPPRPAAHKD